MSSPALARRLGLSGAVFLGLGSMLGAGVFVVFGPASATAGAWLFVALGFAAMVAWANALASAQLAVQFPTSGGTYVYGRQMLGLVWGYMAGWGFLVGKTASCAAMAMTFAAYVAPAGWERAVAVVAVMVLGAVNVRGITRTATVTRYLVVGVLVVVAVVVVVSLGAPAAGAGSVALSNPVTVWGVLQAAGLLFFAFAGYARLATLGEEVVNPPVTIPRAITIALSLALTVYVILAVVLVRGLGVGGLAGSGAPLADAVVAADARWAVPVVAVGAAVASLGALLALMTGLGRTALAMARQGDLPAVLARVSPRARTPWVADLVLVVVVSALVVVMDVRGAIGFSAFGVLVYYTIANVSAWHQHGVHRRYPRIVFVGGAVGCVVLVVTLPWQSVVSGALVFFVGGVVYGLTRRRSSGRTDGS